MNFIENFLLKKNYNIWVLNRGNRKEHDKYIEFYKEKGIHLIEVPELVSEVYGRRENDNLLKILYSHFLLLKAVIQSGPYDLINMQFVDPWDLIDVILLKYLMKRKLILSYWGSDLFRFEGEKCYIWECL